MSNAFLLLLLFLGYDNQRIGMYCYAARVFYALLWHRIPVNHQVLITFLLLHVLVPGKASTLVWCQIMYLYETKFVRVKLTIWLFQMSWTRKVTRYSTRYSYQVQELEKPGFSPGAWLNQAYMKYVLVPVGRQRGPVAWSWCAFQKSIMCINAGRLYGVMHHRYKNSWYIMR